MTAQATLDGCTVIELAGAVRDETERMIIFIHGGVEAYLPRYWVAEYDMKRVVIPEWLALEKGLL